MKNKVLYSKECAAFLRVFSVLAAFVSLILNYLKFTRYVNNQKNSLFILFLLIFNSALAVFWIFILITPARFGFSFFVIFSYCVEILILEPQNSAGIYLYWLSILIIFSRGFWNHYRTIRGTIAGLVFLALVFSEMRFGISYFFSKIFVDKIANSVILLGILFFYKCFVTDTINSERPDKKLDIEEFSELKRRDAKWLTLVQKKIKYEAIAIDYKMTPGAVKNRFKTIYAILQCGDKEGFLTKYDGFEIWYGKENLSEKNSLF